MDGSAFEQLAFNDTSNDIPTLIEVLKSPAMIKPIANKYEMKYLSLKKKLGLIIIYNKSEYFLRTRRSALVKFGPLEFAIG